MFVLTLLTNVRPTLPKYTFIGNVLRYILPSMLISRLTFHIDHIKFRSFCFGSLSNGHNTIPDLKIVFEEMDCSS